MLMFAFKNLTILYIEDNDDVCEEMAHFLQKNNFNVLSTSNAETACDLFRTNKIDIIITDLNLPKQNGIDFIRCLRGKQIHIPVIITTAYTDKDFLIDAINLDVTRYVVKPFKKSEILDALQAAADKVFSYSVSSFTHLHDGYSYDPVNKSIITPEKTALQLSKKEYLFFELLLSQKNKVVPYATIEPHVWKNSPMSIDALRTLVRGLRKKSYPHLITNVNAIGYRIDL